MRRSQPLDENNEKLMKWLGVKEETEEEKEAGRTVVKEETVDEMFSFKYNPTLLDKALRPFRRLKIRFEAFRRGIGHFWKWRKLFEEYYVWDINAFLPLFVRHLELYIEREKKHGVASPEYREYKISTAQEAADIIKRLVADEYLYQYTGAVKEKYGKFPYKKTTYANGATGYKHLTTDEYDAEEKAAYEKAWDDEQRDLKRLGELVEQSMMDWWD